ncbi:UNVERIFIED_CONTAM: hypothetical protein GTU68_053361 [Idotea baltica]|nr:hypothetical protein [Idotea baltica]
MSRSLLVNTTVSKQLVIGKIVSVHGIKGEVKVYSFTSPLSNVLDYSCWNLKRESEYKALKLISGRTQGKVIVAKLEGLNDRDIARTFVGFEIYIDPAQLQKLEADEFYWHELEGLSVINQENILLGQVTSLFETGANDVMIVKNQTDGCERLLPYTKQCVLSVNLEDKNIYVDWDADF